MDPIVAKAVTGVARDFAPEARGLLNRLLDPLFEEWGINLRDAAVAKRQRNLERIAAAAGRQLNAANPLGLSAPVTNTRTAFALLDGASLEDEGSPLETSWSGLLASAAAGTTVPSSYPSILGQMAPNDAKVLKALSGLRGGILVSVQHLGELTELTGAWLLEAVDNLLRLRLCVINVPQPGQLVKRIHIALELASQLELTTLGDGFLNACQGPDLQDVPNNRMKPTRGER